MNYFDKIYVINLSNDLGRFRLSKIIEHFDEHNIEFENWEGTEKEDGAMGLLDSYLRLHKHCIEQGFERVLIFEDDVRFCANFWPFIKEIWGQVPSDFHCVYFGLSLFERPSPKRYSPNLFRVTNGYLSHAIVYSIEAMKLIVEAIERNPTLTYDIMLMKNLQPLGKCFATLPQLCYQREGISHIEKGFKDWGSISRATFTMHTKNL